VKPAPFSYTAPATLADAVGLLAEHGDEAKPIAGGQSLVPLLAMRLARFEHLVDLNGVDELAGVRRVNGHVEVGAMTRQRVAEHDATIAVDVPLLAEALPWIGHFQIRNRGTIGGSVAHADPASELPAVVLALDAELEIASATGRRTVAAADFFEGTFTTAVADGELLAAIRFPVWGDRSGFAVTEFARRSGDFAVAGVVAGVQADAAGTVTRAAVAFLGMGPTPVRGPAAERGLVGIPLDDLTEGSATLAAAAAAAVADTDPGDDIHASAAHRRRIATHLAARAIEDAAARAGAQA
jgi:carbon-monoxide dehydrogenase medium subunit